MDEEDPFHDKFQQIYPVNELFINERQMDDTGVRKEFFGVLLSASEDEQRAFVVKLVPREASVFNNPATLDYDVGQRLRKYGREAPLQEIVNFLRLYVNNPNKGSALSTSVNKAAAIEGIRARLQQKIDAELHPPVESYWGFKPQPRRGGRKTKKSKRRSRKTRRRHK